MIHLRQEGRLLTVTGPGGGGGLPDAALRLLDEALTYQERTYDQGAGYLYYPRQLYQTLPDGLACRAGLRSRVARLLAEHRLPYTFHADPRYRTDPAYQCDWDHVVRVIKAFRPGQPECLAALAAADCGIVEAATGTGKSVALTAHCALHRHAKVLVTTRSADTADQLHAVLTNYLGPGVGRLGGRGTPRPGRVVVSTADSLHKADPDVDILVGDECHELAADKYLRLLARFHRAKFFGYTATLERDDQRHRELEPYFGPVIFRLDFQDAVQLGTVVPVTVEWLRIPLDHDPAEGVPPGVERERLAVWRNEVRNRTLAARVLEYDAGEQVLVMAKTLEHAIFLKRHLPDWELCYAEGESTRERADLFRRQGLLDPAEPAMTGRRRRQLRHDFSAGRLKKAIATYVWSTGVDFRQLAALARADAGGTKTKDGQIPGRVCRTFEEGGRVKTGGRLIDCWDAYSRPLLGRTRNRQKNYAVRGYAQVGP